jgi:hypothetical protein
MRSTEDFRTMLDLYELLRGHPNMPASLRNESWQAAVADFHGRTQTQVYREVILGLPTFPAAIKEANRGTTPRDQAPKPSAAARKAG